MFLVKAILIFWISAVSRIRGVSSGSWEWPKHTLGLWLYRHHCQPFLLPKFKYLRIALSLKFMRFFFRVICVFNSQHGIHTRLRVFVGHKPLGSVRTFPWADVDCRLRDSVVEPDQISSFHTNSSFSRIRRIRIETVVVTWVRHEDGPHDSLSDQCYTLQGLDQGLGCVQYKFKKAKPNYSIEQD